MMRIAGLLLLVLLLGGCKKYIEVDPVEPVIEPSGNEFAGELEFYGYDVTDHEITVVWADLDNIDRYEIVINRTATINEFYGLQEYNGYYSFTISDLEPDKHYEITLRAIDRQANVKLETISTKTLKEFVVGYAVLPLNIIDGIHSLKGFKYHTKTPDGGFIIGATCMKEGAVGFLSFKLNRNNLHEWTSFVPLDRTPQYNGVFTEEMRIFCCRDNGFIYTSGYQLFKISAQGNVTWESGQLSGCTASCMVELEDGTFIFGGTKNLTQRYCYYVLKMSAKGSIIWEKELGDQPNMTIDNMALENGSIFAIGRVAQELGGDPQYKLSVLDISYEGEILEETELIVGSQQRYNFWDYISMKPSGDENYYLISNLSYYDYYRRHGISIIKIDPQGKVIREKLFRTYYDCYYRDSEIEPDGSISTLFFDVSNGMGIFKIDPDGDTLTSNLPVLPMGDFLKREYEGRYLFLSNAGQLFLINPDGYIPPVY